MIRRGVTLIELIMTMVIGAIAFFALSVPFVAERSLWGSGTRQTEAQRDAQVILRAIARTARQSGYYQITGAAGSNTITFYDKPPAQGGVIRGCFRGGVAFGNQFQMDSTACSAASPALVDGVQSRVATFSITPIGTKLVNVQLRVTRLGGQENEQIRSQLFLRNAS